MLVLLLLLADINVIKKNTFYHNATPAPGKYRKEPKRTILRQPQHPIRYHIKQYREWGLIPGRIEIA